MEQHISEALAEIIDRLERIEAGMDTPRLPEFVYGYVALAELLAEHGQGSPLSVHGIRSAAKNGRMPVAGRQGNRPRFKVDDILTWDKAGRPNVSEMLSKNI